MDDLTPQRLCHSVIKRVHLMYAHSTSFCVQARRMKIFVTVLLLAFLQAAVISSLQELQASSSSSLASPQLITTTADHLSILVVGDWGRKGLFNQSTVADQMAEYGKTVPLDAVFSTGDNFYKNGLNGPHDPAFDESFSDIYAAPSLQKPWHIVLGNHDYRGDALAQFDPALKIRDQRWHCERSFSLIYQLGSSENSSSIQFFFIDTTPFVDEYWQSSKYNYDWRGVTPRKEYLSRQMQDLSKALNDSKALWKIVIGHHPIRSVGIHGDTVEIVDKIYPILKQYAVHLYINGHDHCLEHISEQEGGMQFITSGGGSKAWRGMNANPNKDGLQYFYNGQGFIALSISASNIAVNFMDALGNTLYNQTFTSQSK